jgi:hypothetical protein
VANFDTEKERQRLLAHYAGLTEEELLEASADWNLLTDVARYALGYELRRRKLEVPVTEENGEAQEIQQAPPRPPVTIRRFLFLADALVAKTILDSAEVESYLAEENIVRLDWFLSNFVGGVKVWVREDDKEGATELLNQRTIERFEVEGIGEYDQPICSVCKSIDASNYVPTRRVSFWFLLLFTPGILFIPQRRSRWRCNACGHTWEERED